MPIALGPPALQPAAAAPHAWPALGWLALALVWALESWRHRRVKVPKGIVLHFADLPERDIAWHGPLRVTSPLRTLLDCAADAVNPEQLDQAKRQAVRRGLVVASDLKRALSRARKSA